MVNDPDERERARPLAEGLRRLALALSLPLAGAALLWWLPGTWAQTIGVSIVVIVVALAGWLHWRDE